MCWLNTYTIDIHCLKIYNLFVPVLETGRKERFFEIFCPTLQREQINFIFTHNARILYLSCNGGPG